MIEQEKANSVKVWGYVLGAIVFVVVVAWKFVTR